MSNIFTLIIFLLSFSSLNASFLSNEDFQKALSHTTITNIHVNGLKDKRPIELDTEDREAMERFREIQKIRNNKINTAIEEIQLFQSEQFSTNLKNLTITNSHFDFGQNLQLFLNSARKLNSLMAINFNHTYFGNKAVDALINSLQGFPGIIYFKDCYADNNDTLLIKQKLSNVIIQ